MSRHCREASNVPARPSQRRSPVCQPNSGRLRARRPDYRGTSARFQKCELIEPADFIFYTNPLIELDQVRAAPEQHMLAVINYFASAGVLIGRSTSAQIRTTLEQSDVEAAVGKNRTGG